MREDDDEGQDAIISHYHCAQVKLPTLSFSLKLSKRVQSILITRVQCHDREWEKVLEISSVFCVGIAGGQHLGENESRLNVANYECEFLQEYLRGINMSDYRQGRVSQVRPVGRCRS